MNIVTKIDFRKQSIDDVAEEIYYIMSGQPGVDILILCTNLYEANNTAYNLISKIVDKAKRYSRVTPTILRRSETYGSFLRLNNNSTITSRSTGAAYWDNYEFDYYINLYNINTKRWAITKNKSLELKERCFIPEEVEFF